MKKVALLAIAALILAGCGKDKEDPTLSVTGGTITIPASGGEKTFTVKTNADWSISGQPAWLTVAPASGKKGDATVTVTAQPNTDYQTRSAALSVTVAGLTPSPVTVTQEAAVKPVITITAQPQPVTVTEGAIGKDDVLTVTATVTQGATLAYQWFSNASASNEGGEAIGGATAADFAIPATLVAGAYYYFCEVKAAGAETKRTNAATVTVNAAAVAPVITSTSPLPAGKVGTPYTYTFAATGTAPITWDNPDDPPPGLSMNHSAGILSGTPTTAGTFTFYVFALNSAGVTPSKQFTVTVEAAAVAPVITTTNVPAGKVGTPYYVKFEATGTAPITWEWEDAPDLFEDALTLNPATGELSGTPVLARTNFSVGFGARNAAGVVFKFFNFTIEPAAPVDGGGSGSPTDPFLVGSLGSLAKLRDGSGGWTPDKHYKQIADVNADGGYWTPIGGASGQFTGTYDGGGKRIYNLNMQGAADYQGLFRAIGANGVVKNLNIEITIASTGNYIGGIAGENRGTIRNCSVSGEIRGAISVGGVAGHNTEGAIRNCRVTASVEGTGQSTGGIAGFNNTGGVVEYCYATNAVKSGGYAGGIAGRQAGYTGSAVRNCVALNTAVSGNANSGRVAGDSSTGMQNNFADMGMTVNGSIVTTGVGSNTIHGDDTQPGTGNAAQFNHQDFWTGVGFTFGTSETAPWKWTGSGNFTTGAMPKLWFE